MFILKMTGHRGMGVQGKQRNNYINGARYYPENSMAAFERAVSLGVDSIEFDIHVTKDGIPMVIHGNELGFYTYRQVDSPEFGLHLVKAKGFVESYDLEELKRGFRLKLGADRFEGGSEEEIKQSMEINMQINEHEKNLCMLPKELKKIEERLKKELRKVPGDDVMQKLQNHIVALTDLSKQLSEEIATLESSRVGDDSIDRKVNQKIQKANKKRDIALDNLKAYEEQHTFIKISRLSIKKSWDFYTQAIDESYKAIPTLDEVLSYCKTVNDEFKKQGKSFTINVELKGKGSGYATMECISRHCKLFGFDPSCVVLLGTIAHPQYGSKGNNEVAIARDMIGNNLLLQEIRTIAMVSTDFLYGKTEGPDFDVPLNIRGVTENAQLFIKECLERYNGIDMSLFDYNEEVHNILLEAIGRGVFDQKRLSIGFSATNWKGSNLENSPILPSECIMKGYIIGKKLGAEILVKVDEPALFSGLYSWLSQTVFKQIFGRKRVKREILLQGDFNCSDDTFMKLQAESFNCGVPKIYLDEETTEDDIFNLLIDKNYKPPRGPRKVRIDTADQQPVPEIEAFDLDADNARWEEDVQLAFSTPVLFSEMTPRLAGMRRNSFSFSLDEFEESILVREDSLEYPMTPQGERCIIF